MINNIIKAGTAATLLIGSSLVYGHAITPVDGAVSAEDAGSGYVSAGGEVVKTGDGECLRSGDFSSDSSFGTCEGEAAAAPEPETTTETTEAPEPVKPEPTIIPVNRSVRANFATGSATLTPDGEAEIAALIGELQALQEIVSIDVSGHSDSRGSDTVNQRLSEERAATVASRLQAAFPAAAITSAGYGEDLPIASNDSAEGRAANRRVDVKVQAKSGG